MSVKKIKELKAKRAEKRKTIKEYDKQIKMLKKEMRELDRKRCELANALAGKANTIVLSAPNKEGNTVERVRVWGKTHLAVAIKKHARYDYQEGVTLCGGKESSCLNESTFSEIINTLGEEDSTAFLCGTCIRAWKKWKREGKLTNKVSFRILKEADTGR